MVTSVYLSICGHSPVCRCQEEAAFSGISYPSRLYIFFFSLFLKMKCLLSISVRWQHRNCSILYRLLMFFSSNKKIHWCVERVRYPFFHKRVWYGMSAHRPFALNDRGIFARSSEICCKCVYVCVVAYCESKFEWKKYFWLSYNGMLEWNMRNRAFYMPPCSQRMKTEWKDWFSFSRCESARSRDF
jgi:hypothetical protein